MTTALFNLLPVISAVLVGMTFYLFYKIISKTVFDVRLKLRRMEIINSYQLTGKASSKRISHHLSVAKLVVGSYGDRVVKDKYRTKLEGLLTNSGDWENRKYSALVFRKMALAGAGFLFSFILLLFKNLQLLPILFTSVLIAYFLPDLEHFVQRISGGKYQSKLEKLLNQAGSWKGDDYFLLMRRKIIFSLNSFVISYLYLIAKEKSYGSLLVAAVTIFLGFFIPDILLQNKVLKRKQTLADTLPDAIDMLQMCVNAGLAFPAALSKVADTQNGPVAEEFARVTAEVQLGQARSEALNAMAERTQEVHVQKFVSAMMQVDRFGIPIGNVLNEQSKEMRSARREMARERGQKVPVKILAPIMLCFLPTVLMIILGPAVISIMRALSG